ncbi:MAG: energy transducer TonB [Acidobacteriota bacterium]
MAPKEIRRRACFLPVSAVALVLALRPVCCHAGAQQAPLPFTAAQPQTGSEVTEDQLRQMLVGKTFYLRGCYLDDTLSFDEHGRLEGHSLQGSYTLSLIQIEKVHLSKHKLEIEGIRYGLHFLGALPYEDPASSVDHVRITPKKKAMKLTIGREQTVKAKKEKSRRLKHNANLDPAAAHAQSPPAANANDTRTTSPAQAAAALRQALDAVLAQDLDARMLAAMPEFWKLYYQEAAAKADFRPADPAVLPQKAADRKARLLSRLQPPSNQYAQDAGVAGMALYHAVIGPDGKVQEIAAARPIGFGLDENAVAAIREAKFEPAIKDGRPVPVLLDLVVEFRIYSKRTAPQGLGAPEAPAAEKAPALPGPYSAQRPQ